MYSSQHALNCLPIKMLQDLCALSCFMCENMAKACAKDNEYFHVWLILYLNLAKCEFPFCSKRKNFKKNKNYACKRTPERQSERQACLCCQHQRAKIKLQIQFNRKSSSTLLCFQNFRTTWPRKGSSSVCACVNLCFYVGTRFTAS